MPPAGGGREDKRCLKHTHNLSGTHAVVLRVFSDWFRFLPHLSRACRDSRRHRRRLIGLGGTSAPPRTSAYHSFQAAKPASRPTRSRSQAKRLRSPFTLHCDSRRWSVCGGFGAILSLKQAALGQSALLTFHPSWFQLTFSTLNTDKMRFLTRQERFYQIVSTKNSNQCYSTN